MRRKRSSRLIALLLSICLILTMTISVNAVKAFAEEGGGPSPNNTASLKFTASELANGKIYYQIANGVKTEVLANQADGGGAVWVRNIEASEQPVAISAVPKEGYRLDSLVVYEGENGTQSAYQGNYDSKSGTYTFPLHGNTYVIHASFVEDNGGSTGGGGNAGGGNPGGTTDLQKTTASLRFNVSDLADLDFTYQINLPEDQTKPEGDLNIYGTSVAVNGNNAEADNMVYIRDFVKDSTVTITVEARDNAKKLTDLVQNIQAKEGVEEGSGPAYGGKYESNADGTVGTYTFTASRDITYAVRVERYNQGGDNPETPNPPTPPAGNQEEGHLYFDSADRRTDGTISYGYGTTLEDVETWTTVGTEGNGYASIDMRNCPEGQTLYLRMKGGESSQLDADRGITFFKGDRTPILRINGTFNDDPNYDKPQIARVGLKDLYDYEKDCYFIPLYNASAYSEEAITMEFGWIEAISVKIKVDDASQYMLSSGKAKIGIATAKGFQVQVSDGRQASLPVLPDEDLEGEEERYIFELQINPQYFVPYFSFNGKQIETFDTGGGTEEYTNVAAEIKAKDFWSILKANNGNLEIHLTVDKNVAVRSANEDSDPQIEAVFNMIDDGNAAGNVDDVKELDKAVTLEAEGVELSENDIAKGMLDAYEITMQIDGQDQTEFAAPINISVPGEYDNEKEYKVYREHEGEELQELDCQVVDGKIEFQTNKFSKFTIVDPEAVEPENPNPEDPKPEDPKPEDPSTEKIPYEDVPVTSGSVSDITGSKAATAESNAYGAVIVNSKSLETLVNVTAAEKAQGVNVWLEVTDASATMPKADKDLILSKAGNNKIGLFLDISLFKKVGSNDPSKVTDVNGKIKISFVVPENLRKEGRQFEIIRVHNGVASVIQGTYDAASYTFTFETEEFSSYALVYTDKSGAATVTKTPTSKTTTPKTGDSGNLTLWFAVMAVSLVALFGCFAAFRRKRSFR